MKRPLSILIVAAVGLCSCGQSPSKGAIASRSSDSSRSKKSDTANVVVVDSPGQGPKGLRQIASFTANLNDDSIPDTLRLFTSTTDTSSYDVLRVSLAGYKTQTFQTEYPWTYVDDRFTDSTINLLHTRRLLVSKWRSQRVLLLFGSPDDVGDGSNFCIIDIENNQVKLALDQIKRRIDVEVPLRLTDLDGDGRPEFIYRQMFEFNGLPDTLDGKVGTYSPYFVYTVDSNCVLNKPLTIKYNQEHYVFAGFKYSEQIEIFYPNDPAKGPRIWKK
jgi:hypothetical protein